MPRDQLLDTRAGGGRGYRGARTGGRAKLWRRQPAHPQAPLEPEGGLPPLRGRRAGRGRHISFAPQVTWGPILGKFGSAGSVKDRLLYNEGPIP